MEKRKSRKKFRANLEERENFNDLFNFMKDSICDKGAVNREGIEEDYRIVNAMGEFHDVYCVATGEKPLAALDFSPYGKRKFLKKNIKLLNDVIDFANSKGVKMIHINQTGGMYLKTIFYLPKNFKNAMKLVAILWEDKLSNRHLVKIVNAMWRWKEVIIGKLLGYSRANIKYFYERNHKRKLTDTTIEELDNILDDVEITAEDFKQKEITFFPSIPSLKEPTKRSQHRKSDRKTIRRRSYISKRKGRKSKNKSRRARVKRSPSTRRRKAKGSKRKTNWMKSRRKSKSAATRRRKSKMNSDYFSGIERDLIEWKDKERGRTGAGELEEKELDARELEKLKADLKMGMEGVGMRLRLGGPGEIEGEIRWEGPLKAAGGEKLRGGMTSHGNAPGQVAGKGEKGRKGSRKGMFTRQKKS